MLAVTTYLANKPANGSLVCLIVAIVLFVLAAFEGNFWAGRPYRVFSLGWIGMSFLALAFVI